MDYRKITLEDRSKVEEIVKDYSIYSQHYHFTTIYLWGRRPGTDIAHSEGLLIVRTKKENHTTYGLLYRADRLSLGVDTIIQESKLGGTKAVISYLSHSSADDIVEMYPGTFAVERIEFGFDYVYDIEEFVAMNGSKYRHERQKIHKFRRTYPNHRIVEISDQYISLCEQLVEMWIHHKNKEGKEFEQFDVEVTRDVLTYYKELDLSGYLLFVDDQPAGFYFYTPLSDDMMMGVCTKSNSLYENSQLMLFYMSHQAFLERGFKYVDLQDDNGSLSLRNFKERLHPCKKIYYYQLVEL